MPTNAVCDSQFVRAGSQRALLGAGPTPDQRNCKRYGVEVGQSLEQHIGPLLHAEPADPTDNKVLARNPECPARGVAVERRRDPAPRVGQRMNPRPGDTRAREPVTKRPGDGHHGVEAAKRAPLEEFVHEISPRAASETVHGRNDRDAQLPRHTGVDDVWSIAMGMNGVGAQALA